MDGDFLWVEKYRPKNLAETILPPSIKTKFNGFVKERQVPHLLLCGTSGIGKTSTARAILDDIGADYKIYNGSLEGRNIDTLRNDIFDFVTSMSFAGGRKYVLLDEADYLNPASVQPALRNFMEQFAGNAGFILTCNYPSKIIPELHSRCSKIEFKIEKSDRMTVALQFLGRCQSILVTEGIEFEQEVVAAVIEKHFPDLRKVINELQVYSVNGVIDVGILTNFKEISLKKLIKILKDQEFTKMRHWVAENATMERGDFYRNLYDSLPPVLSKVGQPIAILLLGKYEYESAFSVNSEINMCAALTDIMLQLKGEWL